MTSVMMFTSWGGSDVDDSLAAEGDDRQCMLAGTDRDDSGWGFLRLRVHH